MRDEGMLANSHSINLHVCHWNCWSEYVGSVVLFSCLKLGQRKLQDLPQRCWKGINTPSKALANPTATRLKSRLTAEVHHDFLRDLLRWARWPEEDGPEAPVGGFLLLDRLRCSALEAVGLGSLLSSWGEKGTRPGCANSVMVLVGLLDVLQPSFLTAALVGS